VPTPENPKIYHIVHVDRLPSIIEAGGLLSDAEMASRPGTGTVIGMGKIKQRRLTELTLTSRPGLYVGQCVPFYFCPRSVMLFLIWRANDPDLTYRGGQGPIVHLEFDLQAMVQWAEGDGRRWAFTLSNAGAYYFEDRADLASLHEIDWGAVNAKWWAGRGVPESVQHGKQAEFLVEGRVPWELVERIGVSSLEVVHAVEAACGACSHRPRTEIRKDWYYGG
jgi:hypothetical protein